MKSLLALCAAIVSQAAFAASLPAVDPVIQKTIRFIESAQDRFGEFRSVLCDRELHCYVDSTPFVTTFVLDSLRPLRGKDHRVDRMWSLGSNFLREEMLPGGLWRYWTFRAPSFVPILQPDLDDTVTAADILLAAGKMDVDNRELIRRNTDFRGRFLTWLLPEKRKALAFDFNPAGSLRNVNRPPVRADSSNQYWEDLYRWIQKNEFPNETDPAVNANVLVYLEEEIPAVCDYLNESIRKREPSVYYLGEPALYYMYGRAHRRGIRCVGASRALIVERLYAMQAPDGSFGSPQNTALALNTLLDFGESGSAVDLAARYLISVQKSDGSWKDEYFFKESAFCKECRYWRSAAMTSAWVIEALLKLQSSRAPASRSPFPPHP